jgi:hypothetical protein
MAEDIQKRVIQHAQEDLKSVGADAAGPAPRGVWERVKDYFIDRIAPEVGDMLMHKTAQGAAEIAAAINSQSNAFVPYGEGQHSLEVEGPQKSYQDAIREAAERPGPEPDRGPDIER